MSGINPVLVLNNRAWFTGRMDRYMKTCRMNVVESKLRFRSAPVLSVRAHSKIETPVDPISITIYHSISVAIYQLRTNFKQFFMPATNRFRDFKSPFSEWKKEQAEVGRSPTLLALRYRYGGFAYPPGILEAVFNCELKEKRILGSILYIQIS